MGYGDLSCFSGGLGLECEVCCQTLGLGVWDLLPDPESGVCSYRWRLAQSHWRFALRHDTSGFVTVFKSSSTYHGILVFYCRTTSASTATCTSKRTCCPTHCARYCAPCEPLLRAFSEWIRSPPPTAPLRYETCGFVTVSSTCHPYFRYVRIRHEYVRPSTNTTTAT